MMDFTSICQYFNLGQVESFAKIKGGLLHEVWKVGTVKGNFAVKKVNVQNLLMLQHNVLSPIQSQKIAAEMSQVGIPTRVALRSSQGNYLETIGDQPIMIFSWIEGNCVYSDNINLKMAEQIGYLLAKIHKADLQVPELNKPTWYGFSASHWENLLALLPQEKQHIVRAAFEDIVRWDSLALVTKQNTSEKHVLSHRDLDPKNVIWKENAEAFLIDWEYAGLINPILDLFIVSLNWSFASVGGIDEHRFKTVWSSYESVMQSKVELTPGLLNSYIGYCLDWLEFNFKRCGLNEDGESVELAWREVLNSIAAIRIVEDIFQHNPLSTHKVGGEG